MKLLSREEMMRRDFMMALACMRYGYEIILEVKYEQAVLHR